jgi:hypothetical protein
MGQLEIGINDAGLIASLTSGFNSVEELCLAAAKLGRSRFKGTNS